MSKTMITVTVPHELVERLDAVAESEYRSRSSLTAQLIAQGLASRDSEAVAKESAVTV